MAFFTSPNIPTRDNVEANLHQLVPEPMAEALQREFHSYTTIEHDPIIQINTAPVNVPDIPWVNGAVAPFVGNTIDYIVNPGSAPDIMMNPGSYSSEVLKAGTTVNQLGATGVYGPLRAPSINEGY